MRAHSFLRPLFPSACSAGYKCVRANNIFLYYQIAFSLIKLSPVSLGLYQTWVRVSGEISFLHMVLSPYQPNIAPLRV